MKSEDISNLSGLMVPCCMSRRLRPVCTLSTGYAAAKLKHREQPIEPTPAEDETQQDETQQGIIEYKGQKYKLNRDIETALFLGVDYGSEEEEGSRIGTGQRADSIFLFIMDKTAKTTRVLSINRDTITDVDAYDEKGNPAYTKPMQITLQYSFGDSPGKSCSKPAHWTYSPRPSA